LDYSPAIVFAGAIAFLAVTYPLLVRAVKSWFYRRHAFSDRHACALVPRVYLAIGPSSLLGQKEGETLRHKLIGRAGEYSKECFDQAQRIASSTEDPALRNVLRDILGTRDQITADLAKGDAAAVSEIQLVLSRLEQTTKH
jgi:hypothetical protein